MDEKMINSAKKTVKEAVKDGKLDDIKLGDKKLSDVKVGNKKVTDAIASGIDKIDAKDVAKAADLVKGLFDKEKK